MLKIETLRWLIVLILARHVRGDGQHGGEEWSKGDVIQLVALLVGILVGLPAVVGAIIACVAYFKKRRRAELESSPSGDVESSTPPRTTESLTQGMESGIRMPRNGSEATRQGSVATTVSLEQNPTGLSQYGNGQSVAADAVRPVIPRSLPGFQGGGVDRRRHTEDSAARSMLSERSGCGQAATGATNSSQGIHELASWFQKEYDRSNSQIMAERDAWACELRQNTSDKRSVEPDEESSEC